MEDLNKNQIVLLTLLVSFVTSIATGIMTNALLQEAPIEVTRNINRIVEKTIETVVQATPVSKEKEVTTVVVKEEDLIIDSINKNIKSIVRINAKNTDNGETSFFGIGLIINEEGDIATDWRTVFSANKYVAILSDGKEFVLTPINVEKQSNFIFFEPVIPKSDDKSSDKTAYVFSPAILSENSPKLGQTVIGLGGESKNYISVGRISSLDYKTTGTGTTTEKYISGIDTDLNPNNLVPGSPVFNLSGDIIGIKLSIDPARSFTPATYLKNEMGTIIQ